MAKKPVDKAVFDPDDDLLPEDDIPSIPVAEPLPEPGVGVSRDLDRVLDEMVADGLLEEVGPADDDHAEEARAAVEEATENGVDWRDVKVALESGYESRNPNFTAGGTAYVRVFCPECSQPMFFSVETGTQLTIKDGERKLKPTFKATAKVHACHQTVAELTEDDEDDPKQAVADATPGRCLCDDCDPGCDTTDLAAGVAICVPCSNGDHVRPEPEDEDDEDGDDADA